MNIIVYRVVNKVFKDIFLPWETVISARIISARLYRLSFRENKLKTGSIKSGTDLLNKHTESSPNSIGKLHKFCLSRYIILSLFLKNIKHFWNSSIRVENVAEFINPDWGDKVKPARLHGLEGRYDNPMPELTLSPSHGSMKSAIGLNAESQRSKPASTVLMMLAPSLLTVSINLAWDKWLIGLIGAMGGWDGSAPAIATVALQTSLVNPKWVT